MVTAFGFRLRLARQVSIYLTGKSSLATALLRKTRFALAGLAFYLSAQAPPDPRDTATQRMAALLESIFRAQDWKTDPNKANERAAYYRSGVLANVDLRTEIRARIDLAENLLVAGDSAQAAEELEKLRKDTAAQGIILRPNFDIRIRELLAISYLRAGEQRNCLENHTAESCIYPLQGGGIHANRAGAQGAIREYRALLEKDPQNLGYRWLLHVARMAAGEPDATAPLLPREGSLGRFADITHAAGIHNLTTNAGGSVAEDFDNDGDFDLLVSSSSPRHSLRYFRNNGDGTFTDQSRAAALDGLTGGLNLVHTDFNNDGLPDVTVLRGGWWAKHGNYPFSLLRNNGLNASGQLTFSDVTEAAGMISAHPTQTAAWADFDSDGFLDLFIGHESSVEQSHPSQLYRNNADGTFTDIAPTLGLDDLGYVKAVAWGDFNNDNRPDLYVSRKGAPNILYRNDYDADARKPRFTDVTKQAGVAEPVHSFATWFWDYDNDGWLDLFVAGYYTETTADIGAFHYGKPSKAELPRLYRNKGDGTFEDVTRKVRLDRVILPMGAGIGDLDNDGWLDCYLGTGAPEYETILPNRMFRNSAGKSFEDVTLSGGFGQLQKGHAISFADFDRDGDQDIFEVLGGAYPGDTYPSVLLQNPGVGGSHWITLKLDGLAPSNRPAIGARVTLEVETTNGTRAIHRVVNSGTSFGDAPFELHLGLGPDAKSVRSAKIKWPSGREQQVPLLPMDGHYQLKENGSQPVVRSIRAAQRGRSPAPPKNHNH